MLTVSCVLRSGGMYDAEWVRKLRDGVARNITVPYKFVCISDVDVPCKRINLDVDWPAWWAKLFLFKPGIVKGPTLYLDLDTVCVGNMDDLSDMEQDFAMLHNFHDSNVVASGVMWLRSAPHEIYNKFAQKPWDWIEYYQQFRKGNHVGDQAFIADTLHKDVKFIENTRIKSYKKHCRNGLPADASIVCFHGIPRPSEIRDAWMSEHWN